MRRERQEGRCKQESAPRAHKIAIPKFMAAMSPPSRSRSSVFYGGVRSPPLSRSSSVTSLRDSQEIRRLRELRHEWKTTRDLTSAGTPRDSLRRPLTSSSSSNMSARSISPFPQASSTAPRDHVTAIIEAATLLGKNTAMHIAREQSISQLVPMKQQWTSNFARRFKYRSGDVEFSSRALAAMVEEALHRHQLRVDQALTDAAMARHHAVHAEMIAWQRNEEALETFKDPNAEHAVRQAVHAYAWRANKEAVTLRAALESLENETASAQSSSMAAIRLIATKLTAQQDASVATVLNELEAAERRLADNEVGRR